MTEETAYSILIKITGMYNKSLNDELSTLWLDELKELNEIAARKAVKTLKTHKTYENTMPNVPQFLSIYKTYIVDNHKEQRFCLVCMNRGLDILRVYREINGEKFGFDYALHCDYCSIGEAQKISWKNIYSEPISKYFDINELIMINKEKYAKQQENKEKKIKEIKKNLKETYISLSM